MLYDTHSGKQITHVPFPKQYRMWLSKIGPANVAAIKTHINSVLTASEIETTTWMVEKYWAGTPFEPIWNALQDHDWSRKCMGLMVWDAVVHHPAKWMSGHYMMHGREITGRTYFRIN